MMALFILFFFLFVAAIVSVFIYSDRKVMQIKVKKCVHCEEESYLIDKNICTNCFKTVEGTEIPEQQVLDMTGRSEMSLAKRRQQNRIFLIVFSVLALAALIVTILKLVK
jgi:hypothetical protein